jgi:hypothetical protein
MTQRFTLALAGLSLLLFVLAALPVSAAVNAGTDLTIGGYTQARLEVGDELDSSFFTPRMYIFGNAQTGTNTKVGFLLQGENKFGVQKAYVEQDSKDYTTRMGFYSTPFGIEAAQDSWQLPTLERSRILSDLVYDCMGIDIGLFGDEKAEKNGVAISAALTNGEGVGWSGLPANGDDDNGKFVTARVGKTKKTTTFGFSYMYGDDGDTSTVGLDYQGKAGDLAIIAEAAECTVCKEKGAYVTIVDNKASLKYKPYARIDWADDYDTSTLFTLGASKTVNPMTKQTLEIEFKGSSDSEATSLCGYGDWKATFQVQGKF